MPRRIRPIVSSLLAFLVAVAALGAPGAPLALASPGTYEVDRTDDVIVTTCSVAVNDCSLRGAVQNANANPGSTIALNPTSTYLLTNTTPIIGGQLVLSTTTTLNSNNGSCLNAGACAIIKGGPAWNARLLTVAPGAVVSVDHVEFTGGSDANGGGLMNSGTLMLTSSQVFSNTSFGWGGGILNFGTLTISNTILNGNRAGSNGGAISNQADVNLAGAVTLINSVVVTNAVTGLLPGQGSGGGIASFDNVSGTIHPTLTIIDSSILSNTGVNAGANVGLGGGLYLTGHNTLTNVTLQNNSANSGGGIYLTSSQLLMQGGILISNTGVITGGGGGLYLGEDFTLIGSSAILTNVTVQGNSASGGGGLLVAFGQLNMQGGNILSNTATTSSGSGGGIRASGPLVLTNVLVSFNNALGGGAGGGVMSNAPFTITSSTLIHNHADGSGGAIWLGGFSGQLRLDHSSLLSNTATYGAGLGGFGSATITNTSIISDNTAYQGGGINMSGGGSVLLAGDSQVRNNTATGYTLGTANGAGIFNNGQVTIQDASVTNNVAGNGGGAGLYNNTGGTASLSGAALVGNQANFGPGGGIANLGVLTITASAIVSNSTVASGGGISNTGTLSLLNTTLSGNSATSSAGGLYNNGQARLNFVTVAANSAGAGGGLANTRALTLSNTLLGDNTGAPFDCSGPATSLGHNLLGHTTGCTLSPGAGDKLNIAPLITALIDQGGALRFHDLLDFSPALENADPAGGACPATDQRGVLRPIHPRCDIGAIESSAQAYYYLFLPLVRR